MNRRHLAASVLSLSLSLHTAGQGSEPSADELPDGAAILDKMEQLQGVTFDIDRRIEVTGECEFLIHMGPDMTRTMEGTFTDRYAGTKVRSVCEFTGYRIEEGTDGNVVWQIDPMAGPQVLAGEAAAEKVRIWGLTRGDSWRNHYDEARCTGTKVVDGEDCWVLTVVPETGDEETWFVRRDDTSLAGMDMKMYTPNGEQDVSIRFEGWKSYEGGHYAETIRIHLEPVDLIFYHGEVTHDADITDETFALPPAIADMVEEELAIEEEAEPEELEVRITEVAERDVMSIRATVPVEQVGDTLGHCFSEIMEYLTAQGTAPMGPPFTRFHSYNPGKMEIEAGFPVTELLEGTKRIRPSKLPGGEVAIAWHLGHYEQIGTTHQRLAEWLDSHELASEDVRWEVYWTDPGREPDSSKWRTQLFVKLK